MKKTNLLLLFCIFLGFIVKSQSISDIMGYYDSQKARLHYVALLSDNSIWRYSEDGGWKAMPKTGLPTAVPKELDLYVRAGMSSDIRLTCLLTDNSIWRYNEDNQLWEKISNGVPSGSTIKVFKSYLEISHHAWETKYVAQLSDNSIGYFSLDDKWQVVPIKGLKDGGNISFLGTYYKMGSMGGGSENYVGLEDGNSMWSSKDGGKWEKMSTDGLPSGFSINQFDCFIKLGMFSFTSSGPEPKLILCLNDQTMWSYIPGNRSWYSIDNSGLPSAYQIKTFRAYQKIGNVTAKIQILACMEDNTVWNYTDKVGWEKISTVGLPLSK